MKTSFSFLIFVLVIATFNLVDSAHVIKLTHRDSSLGLGAKCATSTQCASGYCGHAHCTDKQRNGHACYKDAGCISGACYNKHTCFTPGQGTLGNGSKCATSVSCASGNCSRARCHDKQPDGAACYKAANCISNSCNAAKCSPPSQDGPSTTTTTTKASTTTVSTTTRSPTSTSSTKTTSSHSSTTTTSSSSTSPQATLKCTYESDIGPRKLGNIYSFEYDTVDPRAFPNPFETFSSGSNVLRATSRDATALEATLYNCNSKFMGYTPHKADDSSDTYTFGQIRIPSLNNDCITATSPGAEETKFTHAPCSSVDDASQIAQFFRLAGTDQGIELDYLGGTFASTNSVYGKGYGIKRTSTDGEAGNVLIGELSTADDYGVLYLL